MNNPDGTAELLEVLDGGVLLLTLNRPENLNALNASLMRALADAARRAAVNPEVGCVVVTGAGNRAFSAGGDMKASAAARAQEGAESSRSRTLEQKVEWLERSMEAARLFHDMPKPTIAMVNGVCAGAGLSLAGACDLRIAGTSAIFTTAFARAGLAGDYGGSWFWTRILGTAKARELYFLSEKIDAASALNYGLVSAVHANDALYGKTMELAKRLADGPRDAYGYMKRNLNAAEAGQMKDVLQLEALNMILSRQALTNKSKK